MQNIQSYAIQNGFIKEKNSNHRKKLRGNYISNRYFN